MPTTEQPNTATQAQIDQALSLLGIQPPGVLDTSNSVSSLSNEDAENIRRLMVADAQRRSTIDSDDPIVLFGNANNSVGP